MSSYVAANRSRSHQLTQQRRGRPELTLMRAYLLFDRLRVSEVLRLYRQERCANDQRRNVDAREVCMVVASQLELTAETHSYSPVSTLFNHGIIFSPTDPVSQRTTTSETISGRSQSMQPA